MELEITQHARKRMGTRAISAGDIELALDFGRRVHLRGAAIAAIGRREIARFADTVDLSGLDGVTVVLDPTGTVVVTAYRNRSLRQLRSRRRGCRRAPHPGRRID